ncbi:EscU/YscU/HrcU family type III secretion system export apparatus switch protein [Clostridium cellulovorans]|uniref:Type III secretion exporter n=1 Tax=Clostridium cellulovorans (strain ATCC 35296 / DSM 3052 / OCM 3 / 743B) TaxID=573061 RepID=D9SRS6_CLOC7|nr:EscU/YscU/HrcU family type III secretion system export apparatus switch protein [Clostridium cellulovorans]ADL50443.1 type III secretion exporter [Clostridium cellulovorans 743B]
MKKIRKAAALKYEQGYESPIVAAQGVGYVAEKIVEKADENDVPIVYNKEMADLLTNVDVGDSIPEELYAAVAEIMAHIMEIDRDAKGR